MLAYRLCFTTMCKLPVLPFALFVAVGFPAFQRRATFLTLPARAIVSRESGFHLQRITRASLPTTLAPSARCYSSPRTTFPNRCLSHSGLARGAVVGQGDSYEAALSDVRSAIAFHVETFGASALAFAEDDPVLEAFVAETAVPA